MTSVVCGLIICKLFTLGVDISWVRGKLCTDPEYSDWQKMNRSRGKDQPNPIQNIRLDRVWGAGWSFFFYLSIIYLDKISYDFSNILLYIYSDRTGQADSLLAQPHNLLKLLFSLQFSNPI